MEAETDWEALVRSYQAAVRSFEAVSAALTDALTSRSIGAHLLQFVSAEEAARERVVAARMRLLRYWRVSLEDTGTLPALGRE